MPKYKVTYNYRRQLGDIKIEWLDDYEKAKEVCRINQDTDAFMLWEEQDEEYHLFCGYWRRGRWQIQEQYEGGI